MTIPRTLSTIGVLSIGVVMTACSSAPVQPQAATCGQDYTCIRDLVSQYRAETQRLSDLAQRYEVDAQTLSQELGQDSDEVKRKRTLAKNAWAEAQEADELARQYRSQLPHNMTY